MTTTVPSVTSRNPADPSDVLVQIPAPGAFATVDAVERARAAQPGWLIGGAAARSAALGAVAAAIEAAADELAALAVREVGKPLAEARAEVARTVAIWRYYAQAPYEPTGAVHETAAGPGLLLTRRRPYGVAGLITPWNFPFAIPSWKAAPALAAGNTVVLKPAPEATACAQRLASLVEQILPAEVFTVLPGGATEGNALVFAADVVSFTGSTTVGQAVARAATARGIPVQAEMGGLNAAIVLPDADIEQAAVHIAASIAGYAGQKCTATSRVIAVGAAIDPLREALSEALRSVSVGDPADPATACGPLIDEHARDQVSSAWGGLSVLTGGTVPDLPGWYAAPTLVEKVPPGHRLLREEVFGPVAALLPADDLAHAVRITNLVPYGLVTSVHSAGLDAVLHGLDQLDTGMIRVNAPSTGVDFHLPFGGAKASSHGPREQGRAALEFYTSSRTYTLSPAGTM
ncbi:aldehyde dehydrogenase family protein [Streptomyces lunaelactis]|uniref:aldehyde dehydrogenase family protein n=1 Tax=Streptomyces lunaelactis TaxID=1535768 RepID=UPI0015854DEC|nr:aldehyde dehydrogenase family protein [Streptomyces lunaelactis]NUK01174.1 aldehyde dehydrogenase family protein [Streptomyces lunaelactis]NUK12118.1 aldehyde dehydrogenase family protein [Streptomyces lunaelactis]NUK15175.1 aldehyde dehydrogenase family protein [Streptomyces lunaelactis]NUK60790.1 aldehyde dehydrogenase family protein [Streptomyces lunaelactis]NUK69715.1 aldehyde dehydrogenase family protein [Streptomyces lunaelactis]